MQFAKGKVINRETIELNEEALKAIIAHLGTRVGVDTLEVHVQAFYGLLHQPISSARPCIHCNVSLQGILSGVRLIGSRV